MGKKMPVCPLCQSRADAFETDRFFVCRRCRGIFRSRDHFLPPDKEKERYLKHNNDVHDSGYQRFVSPITEAVMHDFTPEQLGLDFGAGPGPVISKVLQDQGYNIRAYDPFFHHHPQYLETVYDYIVCCEVIEHFQDPRQSFALLKKLMKHNAKLYCMTHLYDSETDFTNWYYQREPSHVFFYHAETMAWIAENGRFSKTTIQDRLIIFENHR